jgi:phospholipid/cholesterol/gamma-HCH transport system substrate-binding protein
MERDANYVAVGAFVLLVIAMGVAFVLWYSGGRDRRDYQIYEIYFDGTVSGLTKGGPVRYLGVDVGRVRRLSIDPQRPGQVKVLAEIDSSAPIDGSTRARLGLQGVTGLLYIDLKSDPSVPVGTPLAGGKEYPVIESVASDFDIFLSSLPELVGRASSVMDQLGDLISRDNVAALSTTIQNLPATAARVDRLLDELQTTASETTATVRTVRAFVTDADPTLRAAVDRMGQLADDLATTAERLDHFAAETESQVGHFTDHGLFELEQLLREGRAAAREFRTLSRDLRQNPSQILYEPGQSGVEIAP